MSQSKLKILVIPRRPGMVSQFLRESLAPRMRLSGVEVSVTAELPDRSVLSQFDSIIADVFSMDEILRIRTCNPQSKIGFADPKVLTTRDEHLLKATDFALVASRELESRVIQCGVMPVMVFWVPELDHLKIAPAKTPGRGLYHGNKVHLQSMASTTLSALVSLNMTLSEAEKIKLECHYNIEKLGRWNISAAAGRDVTHVQFSQPATWISLASSSFGIVPNLLPTRNVLGETNNYPRVTKILRRSGANPLLLRHDDIALRYKVTTNAARIYPFAYFGVPVLADLSASVSEFLQHMKSGLLCWNQQSWKQALAFARGNPLAMEEYGTNLKREVVPIMGPEASAQRVLSLLRRLGAAQPFLQDGSAI